MKFNTDECHLLILGYKNEHMCVEDKIWESSDVRLFGITIHREQKFENMYLNCFQRSVKN